MDIRHKKKRLSSINNEVNELHPILEDLFAKLPHIKAVLYTHGTNEMGADFILQKFDETLCEETWIGVIAKTGAIKQDFKDIDRQIDECKIPRYASGARKEIIFNEVWIVTTGSISNNAQKKIYHKYKSTNIQFIDDEKLIYLIEQHTPYFWHDVPHIISSYLTKLSTRNEDRETDSNLLGNYGDNFYIELEIEKIIESPYEKKKKPKLVDFYKEILEQKLCFIDGEMGSGKSKLLRKIISRLSNVESYIETGFIPVYITYKDFQKKYGLDYRKCIESEISTNLNLLDDKKTKYLLFVDGVDEVPKSSEENLEVICQFATKINQEGDIHTVFASRPLRTLSEEATLKKHFQHYSIKPLSIGKIREFIEHICRELSLPNRILEDINKSHLFKQLPHSPIAAILLSTLLAENSKDIPSNLTELYSQAMEFMLGRWDIEKGLLTLRDYEATDALCGLISVYMLDNSLSHLSINEAIQIFDRYLNERNLSLESTVLFEKVIDRSGIIGKDTETNSIFFKHRSFAEFLYAKFKMRNHSLEVNPNLFNSYWANTYFFYVGLHKDCPELLQEILACPTSSETERWLKIINMPNYFLAGFASPYRVIEENLHKLFLDAAQLYTDVINKETDTTLKELPELHILWIFQELIKSGYSYDYFIKSLDGTVIKIDEQAVDDSIKAYALYFLSIVSIDLNYLHPLEFLLKHYAINKLPISISLALKTESQINKNIGKSTLLKKHNKQLKRLTKNNPAVRSAIKAIYEKSIKHIQNDN